MNRTKRNRTGGAAVEFAVAISILLTIVFASIEFVRLNMLSHSIEHASYLGARRGIIIGAKKSDVEAVSQAHLDIFGLSGTSITVVPGNIKDDTQVIDVTVDVPVSGNSWISPLYFGGTLSARTRMLAERAAADMNAALPAPPSPPPPPDDD